MRERDPLQVGERLAGADPGERAPVVARQLSPQLVHEARLVGLERRQREAEDQVGDVVGAVLREREQEQAESAPRVVVEPAEQAEVEQAEPAVGREQDVAAVRIGVVDAVHRDLLHVGAEELPRELLRALAVEAVPPPSPSRRRSAPGRGRARSRTGGSHPARPGARARRRASRSAPNRAPPRRSRARAVRWRLELLRERLHLDEPGRLGVALGEGGQRAQQLEVERDLLLDPRPAHLDDDLAARAQERAVDLRDRGARERLLVEPGEDVQADVLVDDPARLARTGTAARRRRARPARRCRRRAGGPAATRAAGRASRRSCRAPRARAGTPWRPRASPACRRRRRPRRARAAACRGARHGRPRARA